MNNSWIYLKERDDSYTLDSADAILDIKNAADCGWVEQMRPFIQQFSNEGDLVLDPFCGFASTLVAAELEGRRGFGIEVNQSRVDIATRRLEKLNLNRSTVVQGDAQNTNGLTEPVDLIISNIPYFACNWQQGEQGQLYDVQAYDSYLQKVRACFKSFKDCLKGSGYIIVMVENIRVGDHFIALSQDVASILRECFSFIDERVLIYDKPVSKVANAISNRAHEYVLIAQNLPKPIDLLCSKSYLLELADLYPDIIVYGGFARWLNGSPDKPSDVDIMLPHDVELLRRVVLWFGHKGFKVSRWGSPVNSSGLFAAIATTNYLRAEYINNKGVLVLFDISFSTNKDQYKNLRNSAVLLNGVKCVTERVDLGE